jgi:hypothetical protein
LPIASERARVAFVAEPQQPLVVVLPRFSRWMKILSIYVAAAWVGQKLLEIVVPETRGLGALSWLVLIATRVVPGWELWRVITYPLVQDTRTIQSVLWTVLAFWWLGSPVEQAGGARRVLELAIAGTLGGALAVMIGSRVTPELLTDLAMGMAPVSSALLAGWGFQFADQTVSFFGFGRMKGKHLALGLGAISVLMGVYSRDADGLASAGGLLVGAAWMWFTTRGRGGRRPGKRTSGVGASRFRVVPGGRDDRKMWN